MTDLPLYEELSGLLLGDPVQAWRFFLTFADVLGLWPFTLDEFVQAFHDYVSNVLSNWISLFLIALTFLLLFLCPSVHSTSWQDSRLLGELHVALLKSIIKDIEDVARTPATGLGMNQYNTANPEGGHPQIVEGVNYLC